MTNGDPSAGEQFAFGEALTIATRLVESQKYTSEEVGKGILVAAIATLRIDLPSKEVAKLLYRYADDYATRGIEDE